jgi:hypothetical protein
VVAAAPPPVPVVVATRSSPPPCRGRLSACSCSQSPTTRRAACSPAGCPWRWSPPPARASGLARAGWRLLPEVAGLRAAGPAMSPLEVAGEQARASLWSEAAGPPVGVHAQDLTRRRPVREASWRVESFGAKSEADDSARVSRVARHPSAKHSSAAPCAERSEVVWGPAPLPRSATRTTPRSGEQSGRTEWRAAARDRAQPRTTPPTAPGASEAAQSPA